MSKRNKHSYDLAAGDHLRDSLARGLPWGVTFGVVIIAAMSFLAYSPSLGGGFIWDDKDLYLTQNPIIKSADGLFRFWCTTEPWDYYPVSNSSLWIEWRLWGMCPMGYRLTNLILHIAEALLIWIILRRLSIPGGFLAGLVFALHPVNVEAVAWISQRKDMLAVLFFLVSILWYLKAGMAKGSGDVTPARCDGGPRERENPSSLILHPSAFCWLGLAAFVLAMLSKGSAAVLPFFLLGIVWWRGSVKWRDVVWIVAFFLVAAGLSAVNVWFQRHGSGEVIRDADFLQRLLGAGAVVWFYLCKAIVPVNLLFIYPQWHISAGNLLWWPPMCGAVLVTVVLWACRKTWVRPIFLSWILFCLALTPAMGFTDVFFMRYSLVADHYQHIAIIPVIALLAGAFSTWQRGLQGGEFLAASTLAAGAVAVLACLTGLQSRLYSNEITLYTATLNRNPECWMAHNNLGIALSQVGANQEAIAHFEQSVRLNPDYPQAHDNLGAALLHTDRRQEGIEQIREALTIKPNDSEAHCLLGNVAREEGRFQEAIDHYRQALALRPDFLEALNNLGLSLVKAGRPEEAIEKYEKALKIDPDFLFAEANLGNAYKQMGQSRLAIEHFEKALQLARAQGQTALADQIERSLNAYRARASDVSGVPPSDESPAPPP
jgi:protein O-mannosyl-transferase